MGPDLASFENSLCQIFFQGYPKRMVTFRAFWKITFWATIGKLRANFYVNIWSHWIFLQIFLQNWHLNRVASPPFLDPFENMLEEDFHLPVSFFFFSSTSVSSTTTTSESSSSSSSSASDVWSHFSCTISVRLLEMIAWKLIESGSVTKLVRFTAQSIMLLWTKWSSLVDFE